MSQFKPVLHALRPLSWLGSRRGEPAPNSGVGGGLVEPALNAMDFELLERVRPQATAQDPGFRTDDPADKPGEALREAFTPTRPRLMGPLFVGRNQYLRRMIAAVEEERAHIVLFGERGRGKTSLANAFASLATEAGLLTVRRSCGANTTFERLFRALLAGVPGRVLAGAGAPASAADLLPPGAFGAEEVTEVLGRLRGSRLVMVIDEFDRAESEALRAEVAETVKNLSDEAVPATLLLVGVAASLDDLLGRQPSLQRAILAVHLTAMGDDDVARLVTGGATAAGFQFEPAAVRGVVRLSRGMPYYAHLLSLYAARAAEREGRRIVRPAEVVAAAAEALDKQEPVVRAGWAEALTVPGAEPALLAAAMAPRDADDRFEAAALPAAMAPVLEALTEPAAGPALRREAGGYGFTIPALAHHVLLRAAAVVIAA